jgi:hypothetical protein
MDLTQAAIEGAKHVYVLSDDFISLYLRIDAISTTAGVGAVGEPFYWYGCC